MFVFHGYCGALEDSPEVPPGPFVALAAGDAHLLLVRQDGTAAAVGANEQGQAAVPALPPGVKYVAPTTRPQVRMGISREREKTIDPI